jgi:hypothetical protein
VHGDLAHGAHQVVSAVIAVIAAIAAIAALTTVAAAVARTVVSVAPISVAAPTTVTAAHAPESGARAARGGATRVSGRSAAVQDELDDIGEELRQAHASRFATGDRHGAVDEIDCARISTPSFAGPRRSVLGSIRHRAVTAKEGDYSSLG